MPLIIIAVICTIGFLLFGRTHQVQQAQPNHVNVQDLRVTGENKALFVGIVVMLLIFVVLLRLTLGAIVGVIALSIFWLKVRQGQLLGQAVKVSAKQLPMVFEPALRAAVNLSMPLPDIFVVQNPVINAYALGFLGRKSIVINSGTIEAMDADELCFIIGHELTHIKCEHTYWLVFTNLQDTIRLPIISNVVGFLLLNWSRKAEYTGDRGGLVACHDIRSAISSMSKLVVGKQLFEQLNLQELSNQKGVVDTDVIAKVSEVLGDHPYIVNRMHQLYAYSKTEYFNTLHSR